MIETYKDHRMAMAFAIASARLSGMKIRDEQVVNKSFPTFWKVLESLLFHHLSYEYHFYQFMGSGKSSVGKLIAQRQSRSTYRNG